MLRESLGHRRRDERLMERTGVLEVAKGLSKDADVLDVALAQALRVEAAAAHTAAGKVHNEGRVVHPRLVYVQPPASGSTMVVRLCGGLSMPSAPTLQTTGAAYTWQWWACRLITQGDRIRMYCCIVNARDSMQTVFHMH